jgi:hypothetical protein
MSCERYVHASFRIVQTRFGESDTRSPQTTSRESAISRIFGGKLRSVLRTPGQKDSVTLEPYQPLQLDISSPNVHTITEALLHLNEPETISGVYSASRGMNVDATKTVYLETVPPILTLHLKRFLYDPVEMRVVKKGKAVAYGPELLIPSSIISPARRPSGGDLRYKLFGGKFIVCLVLIAYVLMLRTFQSYTTMAIRRQEVTTLRAS